VLEGGLGHKRDTPAQQQLNRLEKRLVHLQVGSLAEGDMITPLCVHSSFLELIPAQAGTPDLPRQRMRQRRLAGAGPTGDDQQEGLIHFASGICSQRFNHA
jgi:hypothetical protein